MRFPGREIAGDAGPVDFAAMAVMLIVVQGKARCCFALLFGFGIATLMARHRGHDVTTVSSAAEFVACLESRSFDVAIINTLMPDADGLEIVGAIREREGDGQRFARDSDRIPILVLTTHDAPLDPHRMRELGVDGYIAKPIQADEYATAIERASRVLS